METLLFIALIIGSYLLGNIHFARIISKFRKDDITKHGSGNPGTMNMVRNHGIILGVLTLLADALKGAIPAVVAYFIFKSPYDSHIFWVSFKQPEIIQVYVVGFFAVVGHIFPVVYKFKGGKGVATAFGFFTVLNPLLSLSLFLLGILILLIFKMGSLSSLIYIFVFTLTQTFLIFSSSNMLPIIIMWVVVVLIFYAHRSNIKRMFSGKESRLKMNEVIEKDKQLIKGNLDKIKSNKNKQ